MEQPNSFGEWLRRRRRALDWTQEELAKQAGCAAGTIRKIEADELRPSKQLAEILAQRLGVPPKDLEDFVHFARGVLPGVSPTWPFVEEMAGLPDRRGAKPTHNLPAQLTSFIGREREIAEVKRLLEQTRLLTLTGAGGCGKTRLALQVAANLVDAGQFSNGVWLIELTPVGDPALVPQTVAAVLGLRQEQARPLLETVTDYSRERTLLLVLDNCEHLIDACAKFADVLLHACPHTRILATSREALGILGEAVWRVPSLTVPDLQILPPSDAWMTYEGIRLFVERAAAASPGFDLTEQNARWIAQICGRLDGIPLAIELAAARVQVLTPEQIAGRLDDRFNLLTSGNRAALPRHQTLRTLTDWSYDLLSEPERVLLRRLSVFAGGFTLEAAEAVCAQDQSTMMNIGIRPGEALGLLSQLVAKSLVGVEQRDPQPRYTLLETIRQYAYDRLLEVGEAEKARDFHLGFFLRLTEETDLTPSIIWQTAWLNRVEAEYDNLRAALHWAEESQAGGAALRLVLILSGLWEVRGHISQARERMAAVLSMPTVAEPAWAHLRAMTLAHSAYLAHVQSDYVAGVPLVQEAMAIFKQLGDRRWAALLLRDLWFTAWTRGDYVSARELCEEKLAISRELGDKHAIADSTEILAVSLRETGDYSGARALLEEALSVWQELGDKRALASSLMNMGATAHAQDDDLAASALLEEGLTIFQGLGDKLNVARCLHDLGAVAASQGDQMLARSRFTTSLALFCEMGDRRNLIKCLEGLAGVWVSEGRAEQASCLFGASEALREALGTPLPGSYRANYQRNLSRIRKQLDEASIAAAWAHGRAMTMEQAIAYALEEPA